MITRSSPIAAAIAALALTASAASAQMIFNLTNQGGATPQMMTAFAQAGALWSARFNDPITINVRINAVALPVGQIAGTNSFFDPYTYTDVRAALVNDRQSPDDFSAAAALQPAPAFSLLINKTANNPNGIVSPTPYFDTGFGGPGQAGPENNSTVRLTSANAKALGLYPANSPGLDATITFSTVYSYDFDRSNGINPGQIDFIGAATHEIGHMLGFISGVDTLAGNAAAPGLNDNQLKFVTPLDLFRFSSRSIGPGGGLGVLDWTDDSESKYLSADGGLTPIAPFSTGSTFEASHWSNDLGIGLMDPTASSGELLAFTSNDLRAFDLIGYNPVPEPATLPLLALAALTPLRRHRNPRC